MSEKLDNLRAEMKKRGIDGFFVPRADEFQGEYVPERADRLAWITGFTGSAGFAVVLAGKAAFFTDGRYTLQAREQVNAQDFGVYSTAADQAPTPTMLPTEWIEKNLGQGKKFGIDPWVHTPNDVKRIEAAVKKAGGTLVFVDSNPLDAAWNDQPAAPLTPAVPQPLQFSGVSSDDKRKQLSAKLAAKGADAIVLALPEEVCWLLNIRGADVPCTPVTLSYAVAHQDGSVDLFIDARKVPQETRDWMGANVRLHDLNDFAPALAALAQQGKKVWIDPNSAPAKTEQVLKDNGAAPIADANPVQLMKAVKNATEIQGTINAHIRDGAALTRFIAKVSAHPEKFDELTAAARLEDIRKTGQYFKGLSFDTISGAGGNGAIVHYRSSPETNKPITAGPIYLVDSGAQYLDGTTDVTRTLCVGPVTPEMKEHVTRVLKGHIQVAMATFPAGTTGDKLDVKARAALKDVGLDYAHGTGHGVGSYLSVHEGPCGISPRSSTVPLQPGMIISNEPGYYKEGAYGIRMENLVTVIDTGKKDADGHALLGFKTLTLAPFDRNLIEASLLTDDELKWLNDYHAEVRKQLLPLLENTDPAAAAFLKQATDPIQKNPPAPSKKLNGIFL